MEKEYKYSSKVTFREDDKMRISGGPFFLTKAGKKVSMGLSGTFFFSHVDEQGNVWVKSPRGTLSMAYMGEEQVSAETGIHQFAHTLKKLPG
jgi:hypothetical protein